MTWKCREHFYSAPMLISVEVHTRHEAPQTIFRGSRHGVLASASALFYWREVSVQSSQLYTSPSKKNNKIQLIFRFKYFKIKYHIKRSSCICSKFEEHCGDFIFFFSLQDLLVRFAVCELFLFNVHLTVG